MLWDVAKPVHILQSCKYKNCTHIASVTNQKEPCANFPFFHAHSILVKIKVTSNALTTSPACEYFLCYLFICLDGDGGLKPRNALTQCLWLAGLLHQPSPTKHLTIKELQNPSINVSEYRKASKSFYVHFEKSGPAIPF